MVLSSSLLSDLEGLSLSNVSSAMQVSILVCVCIRNPQDDIASINVCWESIVPVWLTLTEQQSNIWDGEMSLSPLWNISSSDATYWPFLPSYIYSQSGQYNCSLPVSCISYSLSFSPSLSFALPHPWTLFLCLIYKSTHSVSLPPLSLISLLLLCHLPSLCQMLCPLCLGVVYIWWLTFPSVTAPFSPQYVSGSAFLCIFYLVFPPGGKMSRPFFLLLLCLLCVSYSALW